MSPRPDHFALAEDEEFQIATLRAGWRFCERAADREDAQQALKEWIDATESVLDLGVEPSALLSFRSCFTAALDAATDEGLRGRIRTLIATVEPATFSTLRAAIDSVPALRKYKPTKEAGTVDASAGDAGSVATDKGVDRRSAKHVSSQLRAA